MDPDSRKDLSAFADRMIEYYGKEERRDFPWRRKEATPYEVLMAVIFLQRTGRKQVAGVFDDFVSRFPDIPTLAGADFEEVRAAMEPLGLHWRAENVHEIGNVLSEKFDGSVPDDESIFELLGVGPYTGNMVLCLAYGKRTALVDANVGRILSRVFGLERESEAERLGRDEAVLTTAEKCLPENGFREYNSALVDLGNSICKHQVPDCDSCPLLHSCDYVHQERCDLKDSQPRNFYKLFSSFII